MRRSATEFTIPAAMLAEFASMQWPVVSHGVQNLSLGLHKKISIQVAVI